MVRPRELKIFNENTSAGLESEVIIFMLRLTESIVMKPPERTTTLSSSNNFSSKRI